MSFDFEERLSASPLSENIWRPQNRCAGIFFPLPRADGKWLYRAHSVLDFDSLVAILIY
jgi:hypothetical protein